MSTLVFFYLQEHHPAKRKVYECDLCHVTLSSQRSLRLHRKRRHRKEEGGGEEDSDGEKLGSSPSPPKKKPRGGNKRLFRCKFCPVRTVNQSIEGRFSKDFN